MEVFKRVLFPVDFSEVSPRIASWVLDVAQKFGAEIHLLFVARSLQHFVGLSVSEVAIEKFEGELIKGAEQKMEEFINTCFPAYPVLKNRVVLGDAAEEILRYVHSVGIDLVIMGSHGRKGVDRLLIGSVAEKVLKMSPVPVMIVNAPKIPGPQESE
jgi:nucleotide-binding universal stress UspA family protein